MGGSGSGGSWEPTPLRDPCGTLAFRAQVNSPQPGALSQLQPGTILLLQVALPAQTSVVVWHNGIQVGALTGAKVASLINCLRNGYAFEAVVTSTVGGLCAVDVRPA